MLLILNDCVILILALILVPLAAGLLLLCLPDLPRKILVSGVTLAVCCGTVYPGHSAGPG